MKHIAQRTLALILALMMVLSVTTAFASGKTVAIDRKNFPDKVFRAYVSENFDKNKDGKLSSKEISKAKVISLLGDDVAKIGNLKGVEHFTALKELCASCTSVKTLDLRKNTALTILDASCCPNLKTLKITGLKKLMRVDVTSGKLASLDISGCTKLLSVIKNPYSFEQDGIGWSSYSEESSVDLAISKTTKLMNGKKLLRKYAKPKSIRFSKKSVTVKKGQSGRLLSILKMNPSTCVYPVKFTTSDVRVLYLDDPDYYGTWEKGTVTVTAKCGGKKATIRITVK